MYSFLPILIISTALNQLCSAHWTLTPAKAEAGPGTGLHTPHPPSTLTHHPETTGTGMTDSLSSKAIILIKKHLCPGFKFLTRNSSECGEQEAILR